MSKKSFKISNVLLMGIAVLYLMELNTASSLELNRENDDIIEKVEYEIIYLRLYKKNYDSKGGNNIEMQVSEFINNERARIKEKLYANDNVQYIYNEIKKPLNYSRVCMEEFFPSQKLMRELETIYGDCAYQINFNKTEFSRKIAEKIEEGIKLKAKLDEIKMNCFLMQRKAPNPEEIKICLNNNGISLVEAYLKEARSLSLEGYAESQVYKCLEEPIIRYRSNETLIANAEDCEMDPIIKTIG
ncbi:hypothetical protein HCN44_004976 [Aphidius gifuensis]|uniref:Odorant-binding protein n=1 Tax=Aphidius gifuensis TaxID=684658 RepID=A0A834XW35_APHGI|nr:uncharacterized protein LOC122852574 [Aphidius gifuensis]KAF7992632.1 hypothetical protein HCN44_004976 [Aphidius gifuensis]